jgi:uncharacterized protein (TIGR02453 family)
MTKQTSPHFPGFPKETLRFLRQLKKNNNRDWFLTNKTVYETKVRAPMVDVLTALQPHLKRFAPEIPYDPRKSIFRIYRDVRFSADKSPYKTHISAFLCPRLSSGAASAGLYLHVDPEQVHVAGGLYHPPSPELLAVRRHIANNVKVLKKILTHAEFVRRFEKLGGDQLSRVPRGFPSDHPAADLLRHKDFTVGITRPPKVSETTEFFDLVLEHFRAMMPLIRFLNAGLQLTPRKLSFNEEL